MPTGGRSRHSSISGLIDERAARLGEATFLSDRSGHTVSFAALAAHRDRLARLLEEEGIPAGSHLLLQAKDILEYATSFLALLGAGMVVVPVDPGAPADEVARVVAASSPVAALKDGLSLFALEGAVREPAGTGGIFLCTSGTTGSPKGVFLDEGRIEHVARHVALHHGIGRGERGLCLLPLFHVNAEVVGLVASLVGGAELVLEERFHRTGFWELVADRGITWINAAPAIIAILASTEPPPTRPEAVRFIRSASAPLPVATREQFEKKAGVPVLESYGMTEAASMITANPIGAGRAGSVGQPVGTEVRILAGEAEAPRGEVGRVQVRGAGVIDSYAVGGEAGVIDAEGWLETKDLGYLDDDGFLFLVGRSDDVINRGGEKVYPREVEEVLVASGELAAAVVVGEAHEILGSAPVAYVVPAEAAADPAELVARLERLCVAELSSYKVPKVIHVVDALPVGPTGKVRRREVGSSLLRTGT